MTLEFNIYIYTELAISLCELECQNFEKYTCNLFREPVKAPPNYVSSIVQELYGGGVAVPDPVRAASLNQQQLVAKQIQQTKEKAKQGSSTGPSAPAYKVDDHLLDVLMMRTSWSKMTQLQPKNQINCQKKANKILLVNNLNLFISLHSS